jgi:hypothetical protein
VIARGSKETDTEPRVAYADYNCFFITQATGAARYDPKINEKADAGGHDIQTDPMFAKGKQIPYSVNEADVWNKKFKVSQVLALYRERYAPTAGSPVIGKGDPADGKDSFMGAIGPNGCTRADDKFGKFSPDDKAAK